MPDLNEYIGDDEHSVSALYNEDTFLGSRWQLAAVGDYFGRHARDQVVLGMSYEARGK